MKIGTKIYYTGDRANNPSFGEIIKIEPTNRFGGPYYTIKFDEERFEGDDMIAKRIMPSNFSKGPGRRFMTAQEHKEETEASLQRMLK